VRAKRSRRTKASRRPVKDHSTGARPGAVNQRVARFSRNFLLAAALAIVFLSLIPEACFEPINRFTAFWVGDMLRLLAMDPAVRGTHVSISGFSINVIAECSAIQLIALYIAFIIAFPATRSEKLVGIAAGSSLLFTLNIGRIAIVTIIGAGHPSIFHAVHIYLGQLGMVCAVIVFCLAWTRWIADPAILDGPAGFLLRFFIFSSLPFLLWVPLNKIYIRGIDQILTLLFSLASYHLKIREAHELYYQTFSIIAITGLLLAVNKVSWRDKGKWMAQAFLSLTICQISFRLCNVWISAFKIQWAATVSQIVYNFCVYLVPLCVAVLFFIRYRWAAAEE
jgi:exosortase H (IPTLxxWG-CTERM-specific)